VDLAVTGSRYFAYASYRSSTTSTEGTFAGGILWCYGEKSAVPSRHLLPANVTFNEGVPEDFGSANGEPCLVTLDDLSNDVYSKQVCELFTRGSHHRNISVILITQNLFHQCRFCRDISLKAHYIVTLKNVREKKQFMYLASEVYPEGSIGLYNAYLDATQKPTATSSWILHKARTTV